MRWVERRKEEKSLLARIVPFEKSQMLNQERLVVEGDESTVGHPYLIYKVTCICCRVQGPRYPWDGGTQPVVVLHLDPRQMLNLFRDLQMLICKFPLILGFYLRSGKSSYPRPELGQNERQIRPLAAPWIRLAMSFLFNGVQSSWSPRNTSDHRA